MFEEDEKEFIQQYIHKYQMLMFMLSSYNMLKINTYKYAKIARKIKHYKMILESYNIDVDTL